MKTPWKWKWYNNMAWQCETHIFIINSPLILWKTATFVNLIYAKWKYTHMNNKIIFLLFIFFSFILSTSHQRFLNFLCLFEVRDKVECTRFYPFQDANKKWKLTRLKSKSISLKFSSLNVAPLLLFLNFLIISFISTFLQNTLKLYIFWRNL